MIFTVFVLIICRIYLEFPRFVVMLVPIIGLAFVSPIFGIVVDHRDRNLIQMLLMTVFSLMVMMILGFVSPTSILRKIDSKNVALLGIVLALIGLLAVKYGLPYYLWYRYGSFGSEGAKQTSEVITEMYDYWVLYTSLFSANVAIVGIVLDRRRKRALRLLKSKPLQRMCYDELKYLASQGGNRYVAMIFEDEHARKVVTENEQ